jgi:hypothetical protein
MPALDMVAAIEHQVISRADTGFFPITSNCDVGQNVGAIDVRCVRAGHIAASDFAADDHASVRSDRDKLIRCSNGCLLARSSITAPKDSFVAPKGNFALPFFV